MLKRRGSAGGPLSYDSFDHLPSAPVDQRLSLLLEKIVLVELYAPFYLKEFPKYGEFSGLEMVEFHVEWAVEEVAHGWLIARAMEWDTELLHERLEKAVVRQRFQRRSAAALNCTTHRVAPDVFRTLYGLVGALDEWATAELYLALGRNSGSLRLNAVLEAIAKQERIHAGYYRRVAISALSRLNRPKQAVCRRFMEKSWVPPGSADVMPGGFNDVIELLTEWDEIDGLVDRCDRLVSAIPGIGSPLSPLRCYLNRSR